MGDKVQTSTAVRGRRKLNEAGLASINNFAQKYAKLGAEGAITEFEELEKEAETMEKPECKAFKENSSRNRDKKNICPDQTRVVLTCNVPPGTDYYNANWIKVPSLDRPFIAAQSPVESTINDFWRMVFQENCSTVLLTGTPKENDSPDFWPQKAGEHCNYKDIFVNNRRVDSYADFSVYKLELLPDACSNSIFVNLVVFPGWLDKDRPKMHTMAFLRCWKQFPGGMQASAPIVVASKLGRGRTGAVLLLHAANVAVTKGQEICLKTILKEFRKQRPGLVATPEQYCWVIMNVLCYYSAKIMDIRDYASAFHESYAKLK
ncbi:unnamed protein product [Bursaphelenchus xylophilus]|nr:unnamed protein product [Bursaphelenchus xylophilus]CAG9086677.1 unnamed protein product [Bursaphelenchus xylophilus]